MRELLKIQKNGYRNWWCGRNSTSDQLANMVEHGWSENFRRPSEIMRDLVVGAFMQPDLPHAIFNVDATVDAGSFDQTPANMVGPHGVAVYIARRDANLVTVVFEMVSTAELIVSRSAMADAVPIAMARWWENGCVRDSFSLHTMGVEAESLTSRGSWAIKVEMDPELFSLIHSPGVALDWLSDRGERVVEDVDFDSHYSALTQELRLRMLAPKFSVGMKGTRGY